MKKRIVVIIACMCILFSSLNAFSINKEDAQKIGKKVWHNECGQKVEGLTSWNKGEEFPSLGIGHFIWYPENKTGPFVQTFPDLIKFLESNNQHIPLWLKKSIKKGAPWPSHDAFYSAIASDQMKELRTLLENTIDLQITFIINRFKKMKPEIIAASKDPHIITKIDILTSSTKGLYALIDYLNFKGDGLNKKEQYKGQGWGLIQVLEAMPYPLTIQNAPDEFAKSARSILQQRVAHDPANRNEKKWLNGWFNRINTYSCF